MRADATEGQSCGTVGGLAPLLGETGLGWSRIVAGFVCLACFIVHGTSGFPLAVVSCIAMAWLLFWFPVWFVHEMTR